MASINEIKYYYRFFLMIFIYSLSDKVIVSLNYHEYRIKKLIISNVIFLNEYNLIHLTPSELEDVYINEKKIEILNY